jgi:hypothetical protein
VLELAAAVFAKGHLRLQVIQVHGCSYLTNITQFQVRKWPPTCGQMRQLQHHQAVQGIGASARVDDG